MRYGVEDATRMLEWLIQQRITVRECVARGVACGECRCLCEQGGEAESDPSRKNAVAGGVSIVARLDNGPGVVNVHSRQKFTREAAKAWTRLAQAQANRSKLLETFDIAFSPTSTRRNNDMASLISRSLPRSYSRLRTGYVCSHCRHFAAPAQSTLPAPPLLLRLRTDLKTAMKEKDTSRLNVLRALLAEVTNAAKTSTPIKSDMQLLSLLRKRAAAAKTASSEFKTAGRQDLVEKEEQQAAIMHEYAGGVETTSEEDIRAAVSKVVDEVKAAAAGKANLGDVIKKLLGPGGSLDGKPVEKSEVAKLVKEALAR